MTEIMTLLNLDLTDDSLADTPRRIAKMYVDEIFQGLITLSKITLIENKMKVDEMVTVRDITLTSTCEHHFVTIDGKATVAYIQKIKSLVYRKLIEVCNFLTASTSARALNTANFGCSANIIGNNKCSCLYRCSALLRESTWYS